MTIFHYIINQQQDDFMEQSPPPVKQNTTDTKHVYQHSKHYVGVGSCFKGRNDFADADKKTKKWLFDHGCVIQIIVFFDRFFAIFA